MGTAALAPTYKLPLSVRRRLHRLRVQVDVIGLTLIKLFGPWLGQFDRLHLLLQIYSILATFTILTVEPARLPEFSTTRRQQRRAWLWTGVTLPGLGVVITGIAKGSGMSVHGEHLGIASLVGVAMNSYFSELFWRNILQPILRQWGLRQWSSIVTQSVLFSMSYALAHQPMGIVWMALVIGCFNGWISARYRTLWPGFVVLSVWSLLFYQ